MPQLLPAAAAWAAAAWSSAVTATAVGLTNVGVMAAIGEGATIALAGKIVGTAATLALSAAATAIMRPSVPSTGTTLDFKPDPKAPVRGAMGYTAVGGNKAFQATWGYNRVAMSLGVALSLGPIDAVTQFQADGSAVAFTGAQGEATGFYAKDMWQRTTLGLPGDAALLPPTGFKYGTPGLTGWGSQHAAPQVSFAFWTMLLAKNPEDRDVYTNGVPDPRWIGRWMKVWNPRRDDTYPGGSGPQRRDDWRTWEWSENPYVHALAWYRGHFKLNLDGTIDRTKRIAGIGAPDAALDIPAFVEGMNVADANQWTISGEWASTDPKAQVAMAMLQAGGGQPINRGAQISVLVNMPRVSTYTYTKADLIGQATIRPLTPRRDRKNTIIPRFKSEANNWEYVAAGEVSDAGYRAEDRDEPRSVEVQYVHVRNAKQAGQLAAYDLVTLREGLTVTLPSKVHLMHVHAGDCITVDEPELAMVGQKFVVMRTTTDYKSATVTLELRSETDAKHAFALGQVSKAPPSPTLSAVDPKYIAPPLFVDWTVTPKPQVPGGTSQPTIDIVGGSGAGDVSFIIVEYSLDPTGPWTLVHSGPPTLDGRYPATGLAPKSEYWVSIRYGAKNGTVSARLVDGPFPAPDLIAGGLSDDARDEIVKDVLDDIGEIETGRDEAEKVAELVLETILNEQEALEAEARDRLEGDTGVLQEARYYTDETRAWADLTFYTRAQTDAGMASTLQSAASYTDAFKSEAQLLFSTKTERASGDAQAIIQAKAYTDDFKSEVSLTYVTQAAMGSGLAATLTSAQSYTNGQIATAMNTVYTKAQTDSGLSTTLQQAKSYSDGKEVAASLLFATKAERENGDASTLASMTSTLNAYKAEANLTFAAQSSLNGVSATAALALTTAQDATTKLNEARVRLVAAASGGTPALVELFSGSDGAFVRLAAAQILFGDNTVFDDATDQLRTITNGVRRVIAWGASFGTDGSLTEWEGPTSVAYASMSRSNAFYYRANVAPYFGGSALPGQGFHAQADAAVRIGTRTSPGLVTTSTLRITVSGATGPVTWESAVMGGADDWVVTNASGTVSGSYFETAFRASVSTPGEQKRGQFAFLVTDTGSGKAFTIPVAGAAIYNV